MPPRNQRNFSRKKYRGGRGHAISTSLVEKKPAREYKCVACVLSKLARLDTVETCIGAIKALHLIVRFIFSRRMVATTSQRVLIPSAPKSYEVTRRAKRKPTSPLSDSPSQNIRNNSATRSKEGMRDGGFSGWRWVRAFPRVPGLSETTANRDPTISFPFSRALNSFKHSPVYTVYRIEFHFLPESIALPSGQ